MEFNTYQKNVNFICEKLTHFHQELIDSLVCFKSKNSMFNSLKAFNEFIKCREYIK